MLTVLCSVYSKDQADLIKNFVNRINKTQMFGGIPLTYVNVDYSTIQAEYKLLEME